MATSSPTRGHSAPNPSNLIIPISSADVVPSTSTDGASASATNDIRKRFREKMSHVERIEEGLARARGAIRRAIQRRNYTLEKEETFIPRGDVYRNPYAFHQLSSKLIHSIEEE
ncbi:hypothetical protein AAG906_009684 [Vitis piasezkii]